jgi:6-phosphofructokinase 1
LGLGALEGLLNGQKNVMAGIVNDELIYTPSTTLEKINQ